MKATKSISIPTAELGRVFGQSVEALNALGCDGTMIAWETFTAVLWESRGVPNVDKVRYETQRRLTIIQDRKG